MRTRVSINEIKRAVSKQDTIGYCLCCGERVARVDEVDDLLTVTRVRCCARPKIYNLDDTRTIMRNVISNV
jgi:hypothetical protein